MIGTLRHPLGFPLSKLYPEMFCDPPVQESQRHRDRQMLAFLISADLMGTSSLRDRKIAELLWGLDSVPDRDLLKLVVAADARGELPAPQTRTNCNMTIAALKQSRSRVKADLKIFQNTQTSPVDALTRILAGQFRWVEGTRASVLRNPSSAKVLLRDVALLWLTLKARQLAAEIPANDPKWGKYRTQFLQQILWHLENEGRKCPSEPEERRMRWMSLVGEFRQLYSARKFTANSLMDLNSRTRRALGLKSE